MKSRIIIFPEFGALSRRVMSALVRVVRRRALHVRRALFQCAPTDLRRPSEPPTRNQHRGHSCRAEVVPTRATRSLLPVYCRKVCAPLLLLTSRMPRAAFASLLLASVARSGLGHPWEWGHEWELASWRRFPSGSARQTRVARWTRPTLRFSRACASTAAHDVDCLTSAARRRRHDRRASRTSRWR